MKKTLDHYFVNADSNTGEWLGQANRNGVVDDETWSRMTDSDCVNFDVFERDGVTCAVTVNFVLND